MELHMSACYPSPLHSFLGVENVFGCHSRSEVLNNKIDTKSVEIENTKKTDDRYFLADFEMDIENLSFCKTSSSSSSDVTEHISKDFPTLNMTREGLLVEQRRRDRTSGSSKRPCKEPANSRDKGTTKTNVSTLHVPPMLPPCRVCGEKASGFHYGANTCEACKGFFRRSLQRKDSYRCFSSNSCDILPGKRSICASCRYKKCISIGMSKTAIKTGRYTHEKKTKDIQEVKRLQRQQNLTFDVLETSCNCEEGDMCMIDDENINKIVQHILAVHRLQTPHTPEFFEKLPQKEQEFLTCRKLQQTVFGQLKPIAYQEYIKIYHITGIDVDGRKAMLEHMFPCIEKAIKRFILFAKAIPGFKNFPMDDQIKLIKGSRFEVWLISTYRAFNSKHLIYTHFCGYTVHLEEMSRLYDDCFLRNVFKVSNMIKKLCLTEDEECLLKAVLVLFRDRCSLEAPELVEESQTKMVETLEYIHLRRKPKDRTFFARIIAVLVELRSLTDQHMIQESKINMEWATDFAMPPLLYELLFSF